MKLAYLVSRFPVATETFIVRELNGVAAHDDMDVELFALFPMPKPFTHPAAEPWVPKLHRPSNAGALRGLAWAATRHPGRLARVVGSILSGYRKNPRRMVRALATIPIAAENARTMQRLGIEHVHAHWAVWPTLAAWIARQLTGVSYSFTAHAHDIFIDDSHLDRFVRDAAFVVTVSDYHRAFFRKYGGDKVTPVEIVRYGMPLERLPFTPRSFNGSGPLRAVCIASFKEYKGHEYLFRALALGGPALERIHLDLIGRGPDQEKLEALAAELGISDRVNFLGIMPEAEVAERLASCDLSVLPSVVAANGDQEGLPNALLEALATGAPAVGTVTAGTPDLLREEATCLLAMPRDVPSLAAALEHVVENPDAAAERARAGRALIEREYTVERSAGRLVELFRAQAGH